MTTLFALSVVSLTAVVGAGVGADVGAGMGTGVGAGIRTGVQADVPLLPFSSLLRFSSLEPPFSSFVPWSLVRFVLFVPFVVPAVRIAHG